MNKKVFFIFAALLLIPVIGFAIDVPKEPNQVVLNRVLFDKISFMVWSGIVAAIVLLLVWIGFMFLTSHGEPAKVEQARKAALWAVVGIVFIVLSVSIVLSVMTWLGVNPD